MGRIENVTILKGLACFMVFMSHWYDTFYSWGNVSLNMGIQMFPFSLIYNGNFAVCLFLMLSGMLISAKVYAGKDEHINWAETVLKRYIKLSVSIMACLLGAYICYKQDLFFNQKASAILNNTWLSAFYTAGLSWKELIQDILVKTLVSGNNSFYGPLWMIKYIFYGTFLSLILSLTIRGIKKNARCLLFAFLAFLFIFLNSYYFAFILGNIIAYLICNKYIRKNSLVSILMAAIGLSFVGTGSRLASLCGQYTLNATLCNYSFYNILGSFFVILSAQYFQRMRYKIRLDFFRKILLWLGERSLSIYLIHWIVICSFSCGFYIVNSGRPGLVSIGLNFILTTIIIIVFAQIFHVLIENCLFNKVWEKIKNCLE